MHGDGPVIDCDFDNPEKRCPRCRFKARDKSWRMNCPLGSGQPVPGTRLMLLLREFQVKPKKGCKCFEYIRKMDSWGVAKCRERIAEIVDHLLEEAAAASTELPFGLDLRELLAMLVERAITEAEAVKADHPQSSPST